MKTSQARTKSKKKLDRCDNCGTYNSPQFWDMQDGSVLCDTCCTKIGDEWDKRMVKLGSKLKKPDEYDGRKAGWFALVISSIPEPFYFVAAVITLLIVAYLIYYMLHTMAITPSPLFK